jgi:hypothetical protein
LLRCSRIRFCKFGSDDAQGIRSIGRSWLIGDCYRRVRPRSNAGGFDIDIAVGEITTRFVHRTS